MKLSFSFFLQATLQLTEEQQEAMMHLRRLFYGKLGALRRHRQQLLQQVCPMLAPFPFLLYPTCLSPHSTPTPRFSFDPI